MPSGSSHSHSTPSRMRTSTLSSVLCSPDAGSGSRPACSSASAWNASNHASTSRRRPPSPVAAGPRGRAAPRRTWPPTGGSPCRRRPLPRPARPSTGPARRRRGRAPLAPPRPPRARGGQRRAHGGGVRQRHQERRVGLERRGPHRRARRPRRTRPGPRPTTARGRVDLGPRVPAVRELAGGPLAHARDDAAQHGVGRQAARPPRRGRAAGSSKNSSVRSSSMAAR